MTPGIAVSLAIAFGLGCWAGSMFGHARGYRAGQADARRDNVGFLSGLSASLRNMREGLEASRAPAAEQK